MTSSFRDLPSVDRVFRELGGKFNLPDKVVNDEIRLVLNDYRNAISAGESVDPSLISGLVSQRLLALGQPSLRPVINATGVILHTNLGRAPLRQFVPIQGYSNLEYDLSTGKRGKRDVHTALLLERLLLTSAIVVNNNAAAVFLVLHELAFGGEVIVSRGELIEIGDGFRIPDIMQRSGAVLREVGTTNRTSLRDYSDAINEKTRLILRVHPSNFEIRGFTARPTLAELSDLGRERGIPVYEDLGSGCLVDLRSAGVREPLVRDSIEAGVNLVSFSCDKLLGGPQSGIIAGDGDLVQRIRRNPMYRAFRIDKLVIEALQHTFRALLAEQWSHIPALRMIFDPPEAIRLRAEKLLEALPDCNAAIQKCYSPIGGGSTPDQTLPTFAVALVTNSPNRLEADLRTGSVPVIARIADGRIVLDMRTVDDEQISLLAEAVSLAYSRHTNPL